MNRTNAAMVALVALVGLFWLPTALETLTAPPAPDPFALTGRWVAPDGRHLHLWLQESDVSGAPLGVFDGGYETDLTPTPISGVWNFGGFDPLVLNLAANGQYHAAQLDWTGGEMTRARFTTDPEEASRRGFLDDSTTVVLRREGGTDVRRLPASDH